MNTAIQCIILYRASDTIYTYDLFTDILELVKFRISTISIQYTLSKAYFAVSELFLKILVRIPLSVAVILNF